MHQTTLWAGWYLLLLALPAMIIGVLLREWFHR